MSEIIMTHVWHSAYTERALAALGSSRPIHLVDVSMTGEMRIYALRNPHVHYIRPNVEFKEDPPFFSWNPGCCSLNWNRGLAEVKSEWVINVNPDVWLSVQALDEWEKYAMTLPPEVALLESNLPGGGFNVWMARKRVLLDLGGFDERFWPAGGEDEDMSVRIGKAGFRKEMRNIYGYHMDGGSLQRCDGYRNVATFTEKWGWPPHSPEYNLAINGAG
ncbi:MAG: hypothetical protein GY820_39590 [Gammaproteobacteria bacterium]|nr:hypothetical protein [Gammaproteobacteria bacterium]